MGVNETKPIKLFLLCSSNSRDVELSKRIRTALAGMAGKFTIWSVDRLMANAHVAETMCKELETSDYLIALLSPDYLADEDCKRWEAEATALGKPIIPILLRPCAHKHHYYQKEKHEPLHRNLASWHHLYHAPRGRRQFYDGQR